MSKFESSFEQILNGDIRSNSRIFKAIVMHRRNNWLANVTKLRLAFPLSNFNKFAILQFAGKLKAIQPQHAIFTDVATLLEVTVLNDLYVQTVRNSKIGVSASFGVIGSTAFLLKLSTTFYKNFPIPIQFSDEEIVSYIMTEDLVHETLHFLFLAQKLKGHEYEPNTGFAEELTVTWWTSVIVSLVFRDWLPFEHLIKISSEFLLNPENATRFQFWRKGSSFHHMLPQCPWMMKLIDSLPKRDVYIGERPDINQWITETRALNTAQFIFDRPSSDLRIQHKFDCHPI